MLGLHNGSRKPCVGFDPLHALMQRKTLDVRTRFKNPLKKVEFFQD